jgi:uncharacterized membrane-anchored protein YitT (DUF2179 family)
MAESALSKKIKKESAHVLLTLVAAICSVVALHTFVVPSNFASSGIDGLCTVLYEITGLNMGWFKIMINLPLLILAYIFLKRKYVIYVMFFTFLDSLGVILLEKINFYIYIPDGLPASELIGYRLIAALVSGIMMGVCIGIMLKIGYSSGGVDIVACLLHKWKPHINVERIISICAYSIVVISFFVYRDLTSIFLSAIQIFMSECIISIILKRERYAIEVKIVTKNPEEIKNEILYTFKHGATIVKSNGMYSGDDNYVIMSVMNVKEIPKLMNILKKYPDMFVYFSDGVRVQGDFHFNDDEIGGWVSAFK